MAEIVKPKHLEEGDTVAIVSPSSSIEAFPRRLDRGIAALGSLGLKVVLAKNATKSFGHAAGTPEQRAEDINNAFADDNIKAIIASTGGYNSNSVLDLLNYSVIGDNPKIFCGFSDITAVNLAIHAKTKLVTFNGPTVLPSFGEAGGPFSDTTTWFKKALFSNEPIGALPSFKKSTEESLFWDKDDNRPRELKKVDGIKFVSTGGAEGRLIGGNLQTLVILCGTEFMPDFRDSILYLEEVDRGTDAIERDLEHLKQTGVLNDAKALLFGRPNGLKVASKDKDLADILKGIGTKQGIPVAINFDFGHTSPIMTVPNGVRATVDSANGSVKIIESATI